MTILTEPQIIAVLDAATATCTAAAAEITAQNASIQSLQGTIDSLLAAPAAGISQALSDAVMRTKASADALAALLV